jgi:DNA-directed RNA polymerase specialized sigma24 family protein
MIGNSSIRIIVGNSPEQERYLELTEENLNNLRRNFKSRLKQFHLLGIYEPDEVLNEAVLRLIKALQKGNTIPIPEAWIKLTGLNIVREMKRRKQKCQNLDPTNIPESVFASGEDINLDLIKQEYSDRVHDALKKLSPENQELLNLRFF